MRSDLTARARIRDAALERFGADGVAGTSVRAVAADAGVSAALVLHHFGSKDGLREACDSYVLDGFSAEGDLGEVLSAATPVRRYLARSLLDGTPSASALFDSIVARTEAWLAGGEAEGWVRPSGDARARAVTYVSWLLAPLVLGQQVGRLLGGDPAAVRVAVRGAVAGLEMLTHGLFVDDRFLQAYSGSTMDVEGVARFFRMDDEAWRRHANPWSVWTRFAAIPAMLLAIWSRTWIGWWCLVPVGLVVVWLIVNPRAFPPVSEPRSWTERGIYGERLWLENRSLVPPDHRSVLRLLIGLGSCGFALILWGVVDLEVWPTVSGAVLVVVAQLWRIDRFGWLYERLNRA